MARARATNPGGVLHCLAGSYKKRKRVKHVGERAWGKRWDAKDKGAGKEESIIARGSLLRGALPPR